MVEPVVLDVLGRLDPGPRWRLLLKVFEVFLVGLVAWERMEKMESLLGNLVRTSDLH